MTKSVTYERRGGVGFLGLLALVFIALKLTGYIAWSWAWVLAPLWIPIVLVLAFFVSVGLVAMVVGATRR